MLVSLAKQVLPLITQTHHSLRSKGLTGLRLSVECHACFQWLMPVINHFKQTAKADFEVEFVSESLFSCEQALANKQADVVLPPIKAITQRLNTKPLVILKWSQCYTSYINSMS
jgi:LysR family transcriptional regulator for metE and metH